MPRVKSRNPTKRVSDSEASVSNNKPSKVLKRWNKSLKDSLQIDISSAIYPHKLGDIILNLQEAFYCSASGILLEFEPSFSCSLHWSETDDGKEIREKSCTATYDTPYEILQSLSALKIFCYKLNLHSLGPGETAVQVYLNPLTFVPLKYASEPCHNHHKDKLYKILQFFLKVDLEVSYLENKEDHLSVEPIQKVYNCFTNSYNPGFDCPLVSHDYLIPDLRTYQVQAVHWMLKQERELSNNETDLPKLFVTLTLQDGSVVIFQKYGGFFANTNFERQKPCKGGILADEMGLGKTLEVLACVLLNPRNKENGSCNELLFSDNIDCADASNFSEESDDFRFECVCGSESYQWGTQSLVKCKRCGVQQHPECVLFKPDLCDSYLCPSCWIVKPERLPSPATLIVSPHAILYQWEQEIMRHIKKNCLKVFMYLGIEHQKFVNPEYLASHDIVLTSYETFRREFNHANVRCGGSGHVLRHPKKFMILPSPLSAIEWWRICLDEAQMVESVSSMISKMAAKLHSVNRWCITGTPIQKSVEDLYGLLLFLDYAPFNERLWWKEVLRIPFINGDSYHMTSVLKQIAWRTTKSQVLDQIGIPGLQEAIYKLDFSPIEKLFYEKEHLSCRNDFINKIGKIDCLDTKLKSLDKHILSNVLMPLRKLQQVCCHFQISNGNFNDIQKNKMTTAELLVHLLKTTKYECEDKHRKLIMSMNGLAGIHIIKKDFESAIETFEKVLKSIDDNQHILRTDATQQIHTLFHLSEILTSTGRENLSSFTVVQLNEKICELSETYNMKHRTSVESCKKSVAAVFEEISKIMGDFKMLNAEFPTSAWWCEVLQKMEEPFFEKLQDILRDAPGKNFLLNENLGTNSVGKVRFLSALYQTSRDLHEIRSKLRSKVESVAIEPNAAAVEAAISCHLRPSSDVRTKCEYCEADKLFKQYETKLYQFSEEEENGIRRGTHAEGDLELALKFILGYCRRRQDLFEYVEDGVNELKLIEALKKEFKSLRALWLRCNEYVSHKDEIEMAKISTRLLLPGESPPNPPVSYILLPFEVQPKLVQYHSEIVSFQFELKKKMGQLFYLQNLEKAENKNGPFDEFCPICRQSIGASWSVLQCGHSFCLVCIQRLLSSTNKFTNALGFTCEGIRCAVCREFTATKDVYCIDNDKKNDNLKDGSIQGDYSAKAIAVLVCLQGISKKDPEAKSLVFSSFTDFLYILEQALLRNNIKSINLCAKKHFNDRLEKFKQSKEENVLLIPLNFGCNGLNLVEANHVLLLEPVLDPSKHLQAIGRVHRIGQTKMATVHKFIVTGSIEENIEIANSSNTSNSIQALPESTLRDLKRLFE